MLLAHFLHILNLLLNCICLTYIFFTKADVALLFGKIRPIQFISTVLSITRTIYGSASVRCVTWLIYACPLSIVPKPSWIVFTVFNTRNQEKDTCYFQQYILSRRLSWVNIISQYQTWQAINIWAWIQHSGETVWQYLKMLLLKLMENPLRLRLLSWISLLIAHQRLSVTELHFDMPKWGGSVFSKQSCYAYSLTSCAYFMRNLHFCILNFVFWAVRSIYTESWSTRVLFELKLILCLF